MPIIRSISLKSEGGIGKLVHYIFKPESRYYDTKGEQLIYTRNLRKTTAQGYIRQFREQLKAFQPKDHKHKNVLYHFILSFSPKDNERMDADILKQHTRKFINLFNNRAQWLCVGHDNGETRHIHAHLLASVTEVNRSKSISMSKANFSEIQQRIQLFSQEYFPELKASIVNYGQKELETRMTETTYFQEKTATRSTQKNRLKSQVQSLYLQNRSQDKFLAALKEEGTLPYYRGHDNRLAGIVTSNGRKYRFTTLGISKEQIQSLQDEQMRIDNESLTTAAQSQTTIKTEPKLEKEHDQYQEILNELCDIRQMTAAQEQDDIELEL